MNSNNLPIALLAFFLGALGLYIAGGGLSKFQPMNINFGIMEPLGYRVKGKRNKNEEISRRALAQIGMLK